MGYMIQKGDGSWQKLLDEGRCVRCHSVTMVEVHGHVQCSVCKMYVYECCSGETSASLVSCDKPHSEENQPTDSEHNNDTASNNL